MFEILATAAAIMLAAGVLFPSFGAMRERSRKIACAKNLKQIGAAMAAFANENNGQLGEMNVKSGAPWWKIGYQGPENHSNTRYAWQLVKGGYVDGRAFVCAGCVDGSPVQFHSSQMAGLEDFPSRRQISYSFALLCDENSKPMTRSRRIIAADLNPVFQSVSFQPSAYQKLNEFERVLLDEQLRQMMSSNHRQRGQNALFCDGSAEFVTTRIINGDDDIFTVKGVDVYTGKETPCDPEDIFLVP